MKENQNDGSIEELRIKTEKVISTNELSELTKDDEFSLDKLGVDDESIEVDDIEKVNEKLKLDDGLEQPLASEQTGEQKRRSFFEG